MSNVGYSHIKSKIGESRLSLFSFAFGSAVARETQLLRVLKRGRHSHYQANIDRSERMVKGVTVKICFGISWTRKIQIKIFKLPIVLNFFRFKKQYLYQDTRPLVYLAIESA